jgi:hypothetical protein
VPITRIEAVPAPRRRFGRLFVPRGTLISAWEFLRANGQRGLEQLCFLAGRVVEDVDGPLGGGPSAQVTSCVLPLTAATAGYVTLSSHEQTALILDALEQRGEQPLVSLHTHGDGGWNGCGPEHSEIDDHGVALTPEEGLFSGVVPWYAAGSPFDFVRQTTLYERIGGEWLVLSRDEVARRVVVHDDTIRIVPLEAGGA